MPISFVDILENNIKVNPSKKLGKISLTLEVDIKDKNRCGRNILMIGCRSGMKDIVKQCLENIEKTPKNDTQCTICKIKENVDVKLMDCGHVFHRECIERWFVECHLKPYTPTCPNCKQEFKAEDMECSINIIDIMDTEGYTALLLAINSHHTEIVKMLIDNGCDLNLQDKDGDTALTTAAITEGYDIVKMLVEANANVTIKNKDGNTAFTIAYLNRNRNNRCKKIFQYLVSKGILN